MASPWNLLLISGALASVFADPSQPPRLPRYSIDPSQVTVSGISSGAYMSGQLHVIHSALFRGAGIIAGGPYDCSGGDVTRSLDVCMSAPEKIDLSRSFKAVEDAARSSLIDPPTNLAASKVYIFSGSQDSTELPGAGAKARDFYARYVDSARILFKNDVSAEHGMPTVSYGNPCGHKDIPWMQNCGYDAAGDLLQHFYGRLESPRDALLTGMRSFDQNEFGAQEALMGNEGFVYVPRSCEEGGAPCRLHVAIHGCRQGPGFVRDIYRTRAGYNEWAEANRIIVLYPSAAASPQNPRGCWDWWGYSGVDFANKNGRQVKAIRAMVNRLMGND